MTDESIKETLDRICQHEPMHIYEWKDEIVKEKHPNGLYIAVCKHCHTDYRIPRFMYDWYTEKYPGVRRE